MRTTNALLGFFAAALIMYVLFIGKSFFVPLVISIVIWYIIMTLAGEYGRIRMGERKLPHWLALLFSMLTIGVVLFLGFSLIKRNVNDIIAKAPEYQEKFQILLQKTYQSLDITPDYNFMELFAGIDIPGLISAVAGTVSSIAGYAGVILIYVLLLILEHNTFGKKLAAISAGSKHTEAIAVSIKRINESIKSYVKIKTVLSILTGFLSYLVLVAVGVDFAVFWALIIFILNYIPTVGSILAVLFPILLTLIQFTGWTEFLIVTIGLSSVQMVIGNIIEPKWMGQTLNLSPLVIMLMLTIWGSIWGITGMFLCVPIMVIVNIILGKFKSTRALAIMLSTEGKL